MAEGNGVPWQPPRQPTAPHLGRPPPRPPPPMPGTRPRAPPPYHGTRLPPPSRPCPPAEPRPPAEPHPPTEPRPPLPPPAETSPSLPPPPPEATDGHEEETKSHDQDVESKSGELPAAKDRVGKVKMGFGVLGKRAAPVSGISIKMKPQIDSANKKAKTEPIVQKKPSSKLVAQAFGSDSEEEEEMPPEAKLRMRNIGKDTPTSAGPNSFYKTARGFTDPRGSWRNELEKD